MRVVPSLSEGQWEGTNIARRALSNDITWRPVSDGQEEMSVVERFGKPSELSILFIRSEYNEGFERVVRNIEGVEVLDIEDVQVWHLLKYRWCVLERDVVDILQGGEEGDMGLDMGMADLGLADGTELEGGSADLKI
jgi:large subunit ribosomal protein L4